MPADLSKEQLLAKLRASERPVTPRQLERWWKAGHMARPQRRHVPGLRGSLSLFQAQAYEQAAALYDAAHTRPNNDRNSDRRLDERVFLVWWEGKPIAHDPRRMLLNFASPMLASIEAVRAYEGTAIVDPEPGGGDDAIFNACEQYLSEHPPHKFKDRLSRVFFRNLGKHSEDMFSVMVTMAASALGWMPLLEPSHHPDEPSLASLVRKAFGFAEFESDVSDETQVYGVLKNIGLFGDRQQITDFVLALSDEELETARRCARAFLEGLPPIFECQSLLFGKKTLAKLLRAFASMLTAGLKSTMVIGLAWMLRQGFRENAVRLAEQIEEGAPKARALCIVARTFPQYRELFSNSNLAKLAELPEDTKSEMLAMLKAAIA